MLVIIPSNARYGICFKAEVGIKTCGSHSLCLLSALRTGNEVGRRTRLGEGENNDFEKGTGYKRNGRLSF